MDVFSLSFHLVCKRLDLLYQIWFFIPSMKRSFVFVESDTDYIDMLPKLYLYLGLGSHLVDRCLGNWMNE